MAIHDVTVDLSTAVTTSVAPTVILGAITSRNAAAEFVYGEIHNYLRATASMDVVGYVTSIFVETYSATAETNGASLAITYPTGSSTDDLVLVLGSGKSTGYYPWNTDYVKGAHTYNSFSSGTYGYIDPFAVDAGRMMGNTFHKILPAPASGAISFTMTSAGTDYVYMGKALRFSKSSSKEWNVQHYGQSDAYASSSGPPYSSTHYSQHLGHTYPFLHTTATIPSITSVGWDGMYRWVAGSSTGRVAYSNNGSTWIEVTSPFGADYIYWSTYGDGKFFLFTNNNKYAYSSDGIVWTLGTSPFSGTTTIYATYKNGVFVAASGSQVATSTNGINWTLRTSNSAQTLCPPDWGNGLWLMAERTDATTHYFIYSEDNGETWTRRSMGDANTSVYLGAKYIFGGAYGEKADGTPFWQFVGGYAFGIITMTDPLDSGTYYINVGDDRSPFTGSDGEGYYYYYTYTAREITHGPRNSWIVTSSSGNLWTGAVSGSNQYAGWGRLADHYYNADGDHEGFSEVEVNHPIFTRDKWLIPAASNGLYTASASAHQLDIQTGDILVFQLGSTTDDVVTGLTVTITGLVMEAITWLPAYTTVTGFDAAQYVGYTRVVSGTPAADSKALLTYNTSKLNDRSSIFTMTRIRGDAPPPLNLIANASLTADGVVAKTGFFATAGILEVDAFVEGAPRFGANIGYNYTEIDGNSISITSSTVIPANSLMVITYASDNFTGTLPTITVTDSIGANTGSWVTHAYARQGSSAAGGVTTSVAAKYLTVATAGSYTVTVSLSNSVKAKVIALSYYTNVYNNALTANAVGATSTPSVQLNAATQSVLVGICGWENETIYSSVPSGWYSISATRTGTGGNAATHIYHLGMYRITSSAGTYVYNPVLAGNYDWGNIIAEFRSGTKAGVVMRGRPLLTATADVHEAVRASVSLPIEASLTVVDEHVPATGSVVTGHIYGDLTAEGGLAHGVTATLTASVAAVGTASIPVIHVAGVMAMNAAVSLSAVSPVEATVLPTIIAANTLLTPIIDIDTDPVIVVPPPPPEGDETWGSADGVEPEFGPLPPGSGFGNIVEITNRTYSDLYETQRKYRNTDDNDRVPYQMQAAQGKVASIGGGRALCMHIQENSWYKAKFDNAPAMLVATVINAGSVDPEVVSQRRYELPIHMRGFATTDSSIVELPDGGVIYTVTGMVFEDFTEYSANINLDEGMIARDSSWVPGPLTIATRIDVSGGGLITYTWVKKWGVVGTFNPALEHGGDWSGIHWGVLCVTDDGFPIYETISAYYVAWTKVDPVTGAWIESSNNAETTGYHSVTVTDGSSAALLHEDYSAGKTWYTLGSIDTMTIDPVVYSSANVVTYKGRHLIAALYRLGSFPDPLATIGWLGNGATAAWSPYRSEAHLFKWAFNEDGEPYVATTYMGDNVLTDDLRGPGHGFLYTDYADRWYENYGVAEDDTTPWVYYYGDNYDTSSVNWLTAVRCGQAGYSYVYLCNELATLSDEPRRSMGVHCTYNLAEADDDGKAGNWFTPPVGNTTWDSYFQKTFSYPTSYSWYCNTHAQTMDNGNIVILLTATNNQLIYTPLSDDWADQWENGETRAFVCIVQGGEAPPLKMTQRDDDKREGAARIAYIPVNGDSQRIGSETY